MPDNFAFYLAACQYPGGMLDRVKGTLPSAESLINRPGPADRSLARLAQVSRARAGVQPLILAGDQVYVDATAGLFDPSTRNAAVASAYDRRSQNSWWRDLSLGKLSPIVCAIDDHEIGDNWEPSGHLGRNADLCDAMKHAREQFIQHQRDGNPGTGGDRAQLWDTLRLGPSGRHLLFVGDTRTERSARDPARIESARIMSRAQQDALERALRDEQRRPSSAAGAFKFVLTPAMLLPRRLSTAERDDTGRGDPAAALRSDAWDGYPGSMHALLAFLVENRIENGVFLSGNEHIGCVTKATLWRVGQWHAPALALLSVHAGALYAPYPFANAIPEDFAGDECFEFEAAATPGAPVRRYGCRVETWFADVGDGFACVEVAGGDAGAPRLAVTYYDGQQSRPDAVWPG